MNKRTPTTPTLEVANAMQGHIKRSASAKNIYVQDVAKWNAWVEWAHEQGLSMSELIDAAITSYVDMECPRCKRIAAILATGSVVVDKKKEATERAVANRKKADAERPINQK